MILLLFLIKTCHVSQRSRKIFNKGKTYITKPLYEAEGIEPLPKHHDLYKNHTRYHNECGKIKILKSINTC